MAFLLINRPNWVVPVFQEVIESDPTVYKIQFKRFPADYMWRDFLDLSSILVGMEALDTLATGANTTANQALLDAADAQTSANNAQTDATQALSDAATAQATADAALALGGAGGGARRATMWMDEAHYIVGTPTTLVGDAYIGNFIRYTTTDLAEFTMSFVSGALNDGGVYLLGTKSNNSGIVEVRIDGTLLGTADLYNATTLNNQLMLIGFGFGNPTFAAGYHKLSVKVNGKFVSSLGFAAAFTKVYIRTNAD